MSSALASVFYSRMFMSLHLCSRFELKIGNNVCVYNRNFVSKKHGAKADYT